MGKPSPRDWRAGREKQDDDLVSVWTDYWRMGRGPGRSTVSEIVWCRNQTAFLNFGGLPLWRVHDLARQESSERMRRALAAYRATVEKPSRRKAGEMV